MPFTRVLLTQWPTPLLLFLPWIVLKCNHLATIAHDCMIEERSFSTYFIRNVLSVLVRVEMGLTGTINVPSVNVRLVGQVVVLGKDLRCGQAKVVCRSEDVRYDLCRRLVYLPPQGVMTGASLQVSGRSVLANELTMVSHVKERSREIQGNRRLVLQDASTNSRQYFLGSITHDVIRLSTIARLREPRMNCSRSYGSVTSGHAKARQGGRTSGRKSSLRSSQLKAQRVEMGRNGRGHVGRRTRGVVNEGNPVQVRTICLRPFDLRLVNGVARRSSRVLRHVTCRGSDRRVKCVINCSVRSSLCEVPSMKRWYVDRTLNLERGKRWWQGHRRRLRRRSCVARRINGGRRRISLLLHVRRFVVLGESQFRLNVLRLLGT